MQKKLNLINVVFSIMFCLFALLYSLYRLDITSLNAFIYNNERKHLPDTIANIEFKMPDYYDKKEVFNTFVAKLDEAELNAYTHRFDFFSNFSKEVYYVYSNDENYLEKLPFRVGPVKKLTYFDEYSTFDSDKENRIFLPYSKQVIEIKMLNQLDASWMGTDKFTIDVTTENKIESRIRLLEEEIQNIYPDLDIIINQAIFNSEHTTDTFNYHGLTLYLASTGVLIYLLIAYLFRYQKNISILKADGYSTFNIYKDLFLIPYIICNVITIVVFSIGIKAYLYTNPYLYQTVLKYFLLTMCSCMIITLIISMIVVYLIANISVVSSIKGRLNLKELIRTMHIIKMTIIVLGLTLMNQGILSMKFLLKTEYNNRNRVEYLENWYYMGAVNWFSDGFEDFQNNEQKANEIEGELIRNYNGYIMASSFVNIDGQIVPTYIVNDAATKRFHLDYKRYPTAFISSRRKYSEQILNDILRDYAIGNNLSVDEIEVVEYDTVVPNLSYGEYNVKENLDQYVLFLDEQGQGSPQLELYYFYSEKGIKETRDEISNIFHSRELDMNFRIDSMEEMYNQSRAIWLRQCFPYICFSVLFLIVISMIDFQISELDYQINKKKSIVMYLDGVSLWQIFKQDIIFQTLINVLIMFVMLWLKVDRTVFVIYIIWILLEFIVLLFHRHRCLKQENVREIL